MLQVTVALIVVTLTGVPIVPAICLSWCGEHKTTTEYCHDEAVGNGSPAITPARAACSAPVIDNPFIRAAARPVLHTVQMPLSPTTAAAALNHTSAAFAAYARSGRVAAPTRLLVLRV